jgi:hypothetical protein
MSQRMSALLWLLMSLFCGFLTLVMFAGGGYALWHTHSNVQMCEKRIEEDETELKQPKTRMIAGRMDELDTRLKATNQEKSEFEKYRVYAIAATAIGIVPALMTLAFLAMFFMKWFKKPRKQSAEEEDADDTEEEPDEPKKTKPKVD